MHLKAENGSCLDFAKFNSLYHYPRKSNDYTQQLEIIKPTILAAHKNLVETENKDLMGSRLHLIAGVNEELTYMIRVPFLKNK